MIMKTDSVVEAWKTAARELDIEVVAPFTFGVAGRTHECDAWVRDFGGGIIVVGENYPEYVASPLLIVDVERAGYGLSRVNIAFYDKYDRERFVETLEEWGFTGPLDRRPSWLDNSR